LVHPDEPDTVSTGPAPALLQVPIVEHNLNTLARSRYVHMGPAQTLQVFGKIERVQRVGFRGIVITPIAILSA
jgi:hypothetical protein